MSIDFQLICGLSQSIKKLYLFYNDYETSYTTYINHARWHRCASQGALLASKSIVSICVCSISPFDVTDSELETSDTITLNIKFGKVSKHEVKIPDFLKELTNKYVPLSVYTFNNK